MSELAISTWTFLNKINKNRKLTTVSFQNSPTTIWTTATPRRRASSNRFVWFPCQTFRFKVRTAPAPVRIRRPAVKFGRNVIEPRSSRTNWKRCERCSPWIKIRPQTSCYFCRKRPASPSEYCRSGSRTYAPTTERRTTSAKVRNSDGTCSRWKTNSDGLTLLIVFVVLSWLNPVY